MTATGAIHISNNKSAGKRGCSDNDSDGTVNREKTCPLLLRVFYNSLRHNSIVEYARGQTPNNELQIYTWMDATLRELASLIKQVNVDARKPGTVFEFALVSPDPRSPIYRMRELGLVRVGTASDADEIMLKDCQFTIGDIIDVSISGPPTAGYRGGGGGGVGDAVGMDSSTRRQSPPAAAFGRSRRYRPDTRGGVVGRVFDEIKQTFVETTLPTPVDGGGGGGGLGRRQHSDLPDRRRRYETHRKETSSYRRIVPY